MIAVLSVLSGVALAAPLEGRVREKGTGNPVPVELTVDGAPVPVDAHGRFATDVADGAHTLVATAEDHETLTATVVTPAGRDVRLWLVPVAAPAEVVVESFKPTSATTRHVLDAEQAEHTPGTYEDAIRLVSSLPGVAVQREYSPSMGDLSVRGSAPGDNRYYLDGIELPYLYHFHQYASVFPTSQIDTLELYPSTYGAQFGDAVGAVVDATSKRDMPTVAHGSASINFVLAGAELKAPLPIGDRKTWIALAARRSYQDGQSDAQYTLWPIFGDWSVRVGRPDAHGDTTAFAWGAGDKYDRAAGELDLLDPVEQAEVASFEYRRGFQVYGADHRWTSGPVRGRLVGAVVDDRLRGTLSTGGHEDLRDVYLSSRLDLQHPSDTLGWSAGWEIRGERDALTVTDAGPEALVVAKEAPALARGEDVDGVKYRLRAGLYGEAQGHVGPLRVFPGLRLATDTAGSPVLPEPRLAARWRLAEQTEVKAGIGVYHQSPDTEALFSVADLPTTRAEEAGVGLEQTIAGRLELGVDAYGKRLHHVVFQPIDGPPEVGDAGRAYGIELLSRYRLREHFFLWGWLALAKAEYVDGKTVFPTDGDQPVDAGLVVSWTPSPRWNLGVRWRYGSGLPYTPVTGSIYDATDDAWIPVPGATNAARYPAFQEVDGKVGYTVTFRRWQLDLNLEAWVVPPSATILYPTWNYDYTEQGWVRGPVLLPLVSARARF